MKKGLLVLICLSMLLAINVSASPSYEDELSLSLASVQDVYLSILQERRPLIYDTPWKERPIVSFADITGDDIPEMIYQDIFDSWGYNGLTCLKIITCKEHAAVNLFEQQWEIFAGGMGGYFLFQVENEETLYLCQLIGSGEIMEKHYYRLEEQDGSLTLKEFMKTVFSSSSPEFTDAIIGEEHVNLEQFETEEQKLIDSMRELLMTDPLRFPHPMESHSTYYPIERRALTMYDRAMSYDDAIVLLGGTVEDPVSDTPGGPSEPLTMAEAYLKELEENPDFQDLISITRSKNDQTVWGGPYYSHGHPVSFYDITGDGIPEMFYAYLAEWQPSSFCRIVTYQNGELIPIKTEDGDDFFLNGNSMGNSGTLFTIHDSDHLFIKAGTVAGSTHDSIWEYEYTDGILKHVNTYVMEVHGDMRTGDPIWTYRIGKKK